MYATAPTTDVGLEKSVRIALDYPQPSILESLGRRMAAKGTKVADVLISALSLVAEQPSEQWQASLPGLFSLCDFLKVESQTLVHGGLKLVCDSQQTNQGDQGQKLGMLMWAIAHTAGFSAPQFEALLHQADQETRNTNRTQPQASLPASPPAQPPSNASPPVPPALVQSVPPHLSQPSRSSILRSGQPDPVLTTQPESEGDRLVAALEVFYNSPEVNLLLERYGPPIEGPRNWICRFRSGVDPATKRRRIAKLTALRSWKEELVSEVGLPPGKIVIQSNSEDGVGWREFIIPKSSWEPCIFADYEEQVCRDYAPTDHPEIPVGIDFRGKLHWVKLKSLLVGGEPESGKSCFAKAALGGMCLRYAPDFIQFQLVDLQEATFGHFDHYPWLWGETVTNGEDLQDALDAIVAEGEARQVEFAKYKVDKLTDYKITSGKSYPYLVLVMDELQLAREVLNEQIKEARILAGIEGEEYHGRESFDHYLGYITRGLRKYGIYVIAATQRPEQSVVPKLVRDMFPIRLCFRVTSEASSRIILGDKERCENGAYLEGEGHCYLVEPGGHFWLQGLWIPKDDVIAIGNHGRNQFPDLIRHRKPKARLYPTYATTPVAASANLQSEQSVLAPPAKAIENLSADPDYSLYQKVLELEPKVRKSPKKALGEISKSEFLRLVFDMEKAPDGNSLYSCEDLVAGLKEKFAGVPSYA